MLRIVFALVLMGWVGAVPAYIITADNFDLEYSPGYFADLQGLEWLSLDETVGISRFDIENGYGGFFANGWRYATRNETETLLNSLIITYLGSAPENMAAATWFLDTFGRLFIYNSATQPQEVSQFFYGEDYACNPYTDEYSCWAFIELLWDDNWGGYYAYNIITGVVEVTTEIGDDFGSIIYYGAPTLQYTLSKGHNHEYFSSLLVRSEIPEPPVIVLVGLGFLGILFLHKRTYIKTS